MPTLIICDFDNYKKINHFHFSITKGFELAKGWAEHDDVFFLTTGPSEVVHNVKLTNFKEIDLIFLAKINIVLFIRETNIHQVLDKCDALKRYFDGEHLGTQFGVKSDSVGWVNNKDLRKWTISNYELQAKRWAYSKFDIIYCQTKELYEIGKQFYDGDPDRKLRISPMAVPAYVPPKSDFHNPYLNHKNCVSTANQMGIGKALNPLCFSEHFSHVWIHNGEVPQLEKDRKVILYTGRMKIDGGNIMYMMRDIMAKLGDDYELHIFPGSFVIPGIDCRTFSSKNSYHLQLIRDTIFANNTNVFIHFPYQHEERFQYLYYADVGLDFSQSRPSDCTSAQGNAKLLEYCSTGLPTVAERNINNCYLIDEGQNGILLNGIASVDEYVDAIRKLASQNIDRELAQKTTLGRQNWKIRSIEIKNDFEENARSK